MDTMRIESKFLTGIISKVLRQIIKKQTGCNIMLDLKNLEIKPNEKDGYLISVNASAEITNKDIGRLIFSTEEP